MLQLLLALRRPRLRASCFVPLGAHGLEMCRSRQRHGSHWHRMTNWALLQRGTWAWKATAAAATQQLRACLAVRERECCAVQFPGTRATQRCWLNLRSHVNSVFPVLV